MRRALPALAVTLLLTACVDAAPIEPLGADGALESAAAVTARIGPIGAVEPVVGFDEGAGQLPEGIAADKRGDLYATLAPLGQVVRLDPDGSWSEFVTLDDQLAEGAPGVLGLATDPQGRVYAALASFNEATHGVYRIARDGSAVRLAGSGQIVFPNGLALDRWGNLYVTDSAMGAIWRIPPGGAAAPWIQDETLEGTGAFELGVPIGANGIALYGANVYVANSEQGKIVRVPVMSDGSAGQPEVIVADPSALFGADGLEVDVHGRLYAALNIANQLVRIDPVTGDVTGLAADGLDFPAALAFGTARGHQKTVFITNFAFIDVPGATDPPGPGIVSLDVGVPGRPLP